ncbi:hypothetical protein [Rhodococcus pyridinivorans]|uniref:Uncharacterized protein n=1 Tax=Rhodococcus pyridinivorans TaxID=103816 RepID=A0A7M2XHL6_9NOCA|nr:hypothetical protein [Rhodococcus pyridinivorans]QOV97228.1 hypothetical protein INP59_14760 [Rhodococcus pyridinivorans]
MATPTPQSYTAPDIMVAVPGGAGPTVLQDRAVTILEDGSLVIGGNADFHETMRANLAAKKEA